MMGNKEKRREEWEAMRNEESRETCFDRFFTNHGNLWIDHCTPEHFLGNVTLDDDPDIMNKNSNQMA